MQENRGGHCTLYPLGVRQDKNYIFKVLVSKILFRSDLCQVAAAGHILGVTWLMSPHFLVHSSAFSLLVAVYSQRLTSSLE